jgi:hypothetical protein
MVEKCANPACTAVTPKKTPVCDCSNVRVGTFRCPDYGGSFVALKAFWVKPSSAKSAVTMS